MLVVLRVSQMQRPFYATNRSPPHIRLRHGFTYRKGFGVMLGMHTVTSSVTRRHSSGGVYIFIHDDVYICICVPRRDT
jgi:hypothetical protein